MGPKIPASEGVSEKKAHQTQVRFITSSLDYNFSSVSRSETEDLQ